MCDCHQTYSPSWHAPSSLNMQHLPFLAHSPYPLPFQPTAASSRVWYAVFQQWLCHVWWVMVFLRTIDQIVCDSYMKKKCKWPLHEENPLISWISHTQPEKLLHTLLMGVWRRCLIFSPNREILKGNFSMGFYTYGFPFKIPQKDQLWTELLILVRYGRKFYQREIRNLSLFRSI